MASAIALGQNVGAFFGSLLRRNAAQMMVAGQGQAFSPALDVYDLAEAYYANAAYDVASSSSATLASRAGLPRTIRPVLALAKPAVDWWPGHVYPGTWTRDGNPSSSGRPNRIPYDTDTTPELQAAIQQAFTWGNWGSEILVYVFLGALYGDVFVEVQVNVERQKVYPKVINPRFVSNVLCDDSGNVVEYRIDLPQWDDDTQRTYKWSKVVTKETVTTYRDDREEDYDGRGAVQDNPWGFAPAHWVMHRNVGGMHGASVMDGMYSIINELNGMQSQINDYLMKIANQPYLVSSSDPTGFQAIIEAIQKLGSTDDFESVQALREQINLIPAPEDAAAFPLMTDIGLAAASGHFDRVMASLERNWPEVVLSEKLLEMSQVTAPGAVPLVNDVQQKLDDACGQYDLGLTKMGQMCAAIMGEMVSNPRLYGMAGPVTTQMAKFRPFSLASYERGELDFSVSPRDLLPKSLTQLATEAGLIEKVQTATGLRHIGYSDDDIFGPLPEGQTERAPVGILTERQSGTESLPDLLGRALSGV